MTGGAGFVGHYLAPLLAAAWPQARLVNIVRSGEVRNLPGWHNIATPLLDSAAIKELVAVERPDLIVHLAAQASVGAALNGGEQTWRVNFDGALEMASACASHGSNTTFFYVSSAEVYGRSFLDGPASEDSPLAPANPYARSKASAEAMLPDVLRADQRLIIVRPFNHTGPGQDERFVLPSFAAQIAAIGRGEKPPRLAVGNLDAEREFLDVRDVCRAYLSLMRAAPNLNPRNIFNIASGKPYAIRDVLDRLRRISRLEFEIWVDPERMRPAEIHRVSGVSERIKSATGWTSNTDIDALLQELLESKMSGFGLN